MGNVCRASEPRQQQRACQAGALAARLVGCCSSTCCRGRGEHWPLSRLEWLQKHVTRMCPQSHPVPQSHPSVEAGVPGLPKSMPWMQCDAVLRGYSLGSGESSPMAPAAEARRSFKPQGLLGQSVGRLENNRTNLPLPPCRRPAVRHATKEAADPGPASSSEMQHCPALALPIRHRQREDFCTTELAWPDSGCASLRHQVSRCPDPPCRACTPWHHIHHGCYLSNLPFLLRPQATAHLLCCRSSSRRPAGLQRGRAWHCWCDRLRLQGRTGGSWGLGPLAHSAAQHA